MGYPLEIKDVKYERKCISFNLGIIIDGKTFSERSKIYSEMLRKVGKLLIDLEKECEFVWREKYREEIGKITRSIYEDFQKDNWINSKITEFTNLRLKLIKRHISYSLPEDKLKDYEVPIFIKKAPVCFEDLNLQRVSKIIDGLHSIYHLSIIKEIDIEILKNTIRLLINLGYIKCIDIFQYSNIYTINNTGVKNLCNSPELQKSYQNYIDENAEKNPNPIDLYRTLIKSENVGSFILMNSEKLKGINIRAFIAFGIIHKIIRRVHYYLYFKDNSLIENLAKELKEKSNKNDEKLKIEEIVHIIKEDSNLDNICCKLHITKGNLKEIIQNVGNIIIFPK